MPDKNTKSHFLVASVYEIGDEVPSEIMLIKPGKTVYTNQKPHKTVDYTPEIFQKIAANFAAMAKDVVFDYEHQTVLGGKAPAAGWINGLFYDPSRGLVAKIKEWTSSARKHIEEKEYRFYSPVVLLNNTDTKTGEKIGPVLHSVGLTNDPLMYWLEPLTSKHSKRGIIPPQTEESEMEEFLKLLAAKLGIKEDASQEEVEKALEKSLVASNRLASKEVLELLEAKADTDLEGIKDLIGKLKEPKAPAEGSKGEPDPDKYVAKADFDTTRKELAELKEERVLEKAVNAVDDGILAGKLTPAQKDWAQDYAKSDPEGFAGFIAKAPVVVPKEEIVKGEGTAPDAESLITKHIAEHKCNYKTAALAVAKACPQLF